MLYEMGRFTHDTTGMRGYVAVAVDEQTFEVKSTCPWQLISCRGEMKASARTRKEPVASQTRRNRPSGCHGPSRETVSLLELGCAGLL